MCFSQPYSISLCKTVQCHLTKMKDIEQSTHFLLFVFDRFVSKQKAYKMHIISICALVFFNSLQRFGIKEH